MRIPRFFVAPESIDLVQAQANLDKPELINQIANVLRLRQGDLVDLLDGRGNMYRCKLGTKPEFKKHSECMWLASIEQSFENSNESGHKIEIEIALPILRPNRYEWALEKLTELGATSIVPLLVQRSVARDGKLSRWQSIVKEAAEQCERSMVPMICLPISITEYLSGRASDTRQASMFICAERAKAMTLPAVLCNQDFLAPHKISIIVGAEGGFTDFELESAEKLGAVPVSLGLRILRAETAAIYALSLIVSYLDEVR